MFLITDEFNDIYTAPEITDLIRLHWEEGLISIVDISDNSAPKEYHDGKWVSIGTFPTQEI